MVSHPQIFSYWVFSGRQKGRGDKLRYSGKFGIICSTFSPHKKSQPFSIGCGQELGTDHGERLVVKDKCQK